MPSIVPSALHISSYLIIIITLMENEALILGYQGPVIRGAVGAQPDISPWIGCAEKFRGGVKYSDYQLAKSLALGEPNVVNHRQCPTAKAWVSLFGRIGKAVEGNYSDPSHPTFYPLVKAVEKKENYTSQPSPMLLFITKPKVCVKHLYLLAIQQSLI